MTIAGLVVWTVAVWWITGWRITRRVTAAPVVAGPGGSGGPVGSVRPVGLADGPTLDDLTIDPPAAPSGPAGVPVGPTGVVGGGRPGLGSVAVSPGATGLARRLLEVMRPGAIVLDPAGEVLLVNPAAQAMAVLRDGRLVTEELLGAAEQARSGGTPVRLVVDLPRDRPGRLPTAVSVHAVRLDESGHVAVVLEDVTETRRLAAVRRDFVANVGHELKTPVGALTLLAEAVQDAADDPEAVRRFAGRMQHEGNRLARLVQELIALSRLQGADPLPAQRVVSVDRVVAEALDRTRLAAEKAGITVLHGGEQGLAVCGNEPMLVTALVNLVDNAIAYSPSGTRVALGTRFRPGDHRSGDAGSGEPRSGDQVEISVTDQGIGIAKGDLERIFERFYRIDPARSRATGGTGLGLAIVKHVASNHGGSVRVWSEPGSGSTFTLRLPAHADQVEGNS